MALMVFTAEASVRLVTNTKTAAELREAFVRAAPQSRSFGWLGPRPRVTRRSDEGRFTTRVTWVGAWPPDTTRTTPPMRGVSEPVAQAILRELDNLDDAVGGADAPMGSGPWRVTFAPYSEATHGSLNWWRNGQAAQTRTENEFPTLAGRLGEQDNPIGPTTPETRPQTAGEVVRENVQQGQRELTKPAEDALAKAKEVLVIAGIVLVPLAAAWGLSIVRDLVRSGSSDKKRRGGR